MLLADCRSCLHDVTLETEWRAVKGSEGRRDEEELANRERPLPDNAKHLINQSLHDHLHAAGEQLAGIGTLYASSEVLLPASLLARSAVEHCARVLWLYGESTDSAEDRIARAFLEAIAGAERAEAKAKLLLGESSAEHEARSAALTVIRQDAERCFPAPTSDPGGRPRPPSPEEVIAQLGRRLAPDEWAVVSRGVYELCSEHDERLAAAVVVPFYRALSCVASYYGWPTQRASHQRAQRALIREQLLVDRVQERQDHDRPGERDPADQPEAEHAELRGAEPDRELERHRDHVNGP
jgi:hypothetical protein